MADGESSVQFGWDSSHYDGVITAEAARAARREGIVFATAKIGEGRGYDDPLDATNLANLRDGGIELLGGYHVVRTDDVAAQLSNLLRLADRDEPWWRDWPGWWWQVDLERWPYDQVPAATGIEFALRLRDQTSRQVLLYASRGQYGSQLTSWDGPLWNADYPSDRQAPFKDMYPGDGYKGWQPYSGKTPALLQYASTATIAGMTTCDVNAFRGTYAQLYQLLTGRDSAMSELAEKQINDLWQAFIPDPPVRTQGSWTYTGDDGRTRPINPVYGAIDRVAEEVERLAEPAPTNVDITALAQAITAQLRGMVREEVREAVARLCEGAAAAVRA